MLQRSRNVRFDSHREVVEFRRIRVIGEPVLNTHRGIQAMHR